MYPKSIVRTIPVNEKSPKVVVQTMPISRLSPKSIARTIQINCSCRLCSLKCSFYDSHLNTRARRYQNILHTYKHIYYLSLTYPSLFTLCLGQETYSKTINTAAQTQSCLLNGIGRASDVRDCLVFQTVSTIDSGESTK